MEPRVVRDKLGRVSSNWKRQKNAEIAAGQNDSAALDGIDVIEREQGSSFQWQEHEIHCYALLLSV